MTGAQFADALRQAAAERGMQLSAFLVPLTAAPGKFMKQLTEAKAPRPLTANRIRALIADTAMPRPRGIRLSEVDAPRRVQEAIEPVATIATRVSRDPCPRCAIRGDIGCRHRPWTLAQ
jgi:hypothetical protein